MDSGSGKLLVTDQYALVAHGKAEKEWPFIACSDSRFTQSEFDRYKRAVASDNLRLPQKKYILQKLDDIHALLESDWTDQDIQKKLNRQSALHTKFVAQGREKLVKRREEAAARGDDSTVARLDYELASADSGLPSKLSSAASKANGPTKAVLQQERLAALNKANRKANSEEVRKAQLAEKRAQQKLRDEAAARARQREAEAAEAAEAAKNKLLKPGDDLFGDMSQPSRTGTPLSVSAASRKGTPGAGTPLNGPKKIGGFRKKAMDEDIIASMDLGIDIDI